MKRDVIVAITIFVLVGLGSWVAKSQGFYNAYWFTDVILHILAGVGFGFLWTAFVAKTGKGRLVMIIGAGAFAVLGSVLWEVWEFAGWRIFPEQMSDYVPELGDSLVDILCGFLGGGMSGWWRARQNKKF